MKTDQYTSNLPIIKWVKNHWDDTDKEPEQDEDALEGGVQLLIVNLPVELGFGEVDQRDQEMRGQRDEGVGEEGQQEKTTCPGRVYHVLSVRQQHPEQQIQVSQDWE